MQIDPFDWQAVSVEAERRQAEEKRDQKIIARVKRELQGISRVQRIPSQRRTRPLSLRMAARLMGYGGNDQNNAKRLKQQIADNKMAVEKFNRQTYVFDVNDFPANVQAKLLPPSLEN